MLPNLILSLTLIICIFCSFYWWSFSYKCTRKREHCNRYIMDLKMDGCLFGWIAAKEQFMIVHSYNYMAELCVCVCVCVCVWMNEWKSTWLNICSWAKQSEHTVLVMLCELMDGCLWWLSILDTQVVDFHATEDNGGNITWSLSSYNNFSIDSEGVVTVASNLDREVSCLQIMGIYIYGRVV